MSAATRRGIRCEGLLAKQEHNGSSVRLLTRCGQPPSSGHAGAAIIAGVTETRLSLDTSPDIERRQVDAWRQMSAAEKAATVTGLTRAAYAMTAAGVRQRYPDASPREHFLRVAVIVLGPELARLAYPDAAAGDLPVTEPIDPIATALLVTRHLDAMQIPHTIGGSIASSFAGEPRSTVDIDIVVALEERHVEALVAALSAEFYVDADALRRAIRTRSSTNLIHQATQLKVDLFVAGGTPLDARQIARRQAVDLGDGRRLHVHPPEDILLQKLRWYRRGGEVSDRQWRDIASDRPRPGRQARPRLPPRGCRDSRRDGSAGPGAGGIAVRRTTPPTP